VKITYDKNIQKSLILRLIEYFPFLNLDDAS